MNRDQMASCAHPHPWWVLAAMTCALSLVFVDQSAVNVALPSMQRSFATSDLNVQWFVNAYLFSTAATIVMGGKLADQYGYKRIFLLGMTLFIIASTSTGLASSPAGVIVSRLIQGLGSALMIPASGVILVNAFAEDQRGAAVGWYVAIASIFLSLGPFVGGLLTEHFSWRWVFWINVPIALLGLACTCYAVPRDQPPASSRIDWCGFLLLASGIISLLLSFTGFYTFNGIALSVLVLFILGCILLGSFIYHQTRCSNPLVDLSLFSIKPYRVSVTIVVIIQLVTVLLIFLTLYMQNILRHSPATSGLLLLPFTLPIAILAPLGGWLRDRHGPGLPVRIGAALFVIGTAGLSYALWQRDYHWLVPMLLCLGSALPLCMSSCIATALASANPDQRGVASGVVNSVRQLSGALGLAMFGAWIHRVELTHLQTQLDRLQVSVPHTLSTRQLNGLLADAPDAVQALASLPQAAKESVHQAAEAAYITGFSVIVLCVSLLGLYAYYLTHHLPKKAPAAETRGST